MNLSIPYLSKILVGLLCLVFLAAPAASNGTELKEQTLKAWEVYIQQTNLQMSDRVRSAFLWVDQVPDGVRSVRAGNILISSVGEQNPKPVPSGLIHDWIGAAFIPNAKLEDVLSVARDYRHYKEFYKPSVVDSRSLATEGSCDEYSMRVVNKAVVAEMAFDTEYRACYLRLDDQRVSSTAYSTRVQEIRHYGRSDEKKLLPNQGSGYIWRLYSMTRFEERDGGVYVELEAIVLSRDVPVAVRWLVNPIVRSLSKSSLLTSLTQMKEAVRLTAGTVYGTTKRSSVAAGGPERALAQLALRRCANAQSPEMLIVATSSFDFDVSRGSARTPDKQRITDYLVFGPV